MCRASSLSENRRPLLWMLLRMLEEGGGGVSYLCTPKKEFNLSSMLLNGLKSARLEPVLKLSPNLNNHGKLFL